MSLIIVKNNVPEMALFKSAIKEEHQIVDYTANLTVQNVVDLIGNKTHLAFVYHFLGDNYVPFFRDKREKKDKSEKKPLSLFSSNIIDLFTKIKNKNGSLTVDLICCNLNGTEFEDAVKKIENDLGINIRYSIDLTGNKNGNWLLESDSIDIKDYYFNENINNWNHVLAGSITLNQLQLLNPLIFTKTDNTYTLANSINIKDVKFTDITNFTGNDCFIELDKDDIFDGNNKIIEIDWINLGLFSIKSTVGNADNKPIIKNLTINSNGDIGYTLNNDDNNQEGGGGFIRKLNKRCKVENCTSNGNINTSGIFDLDNYYGGGGICGYGNYKDTYMTIENCEHSGIKVAWSGGICGEGNYNCVITNCLSTGNINQYNAGGICGYDCNYCVITNCLSTGDINGHYAGGICGHNCDYCVITNCSSTGDINGDYAGGICGEGCDYCLITNCDSSGNIVGNYASGICSGSSNGTKITNCYSIGNIIGNFASGIYNGDDTEDYTLIQNCFSVGNIRGNNSGGIVSYASNTIITNSYSIGNIRGNNSGGICGFCTLDDNGETSTILVSNSYSYGSILGLDSGGIFGTLDDSNCYLFNSYCNGNVVGRVNNGELYINNITTPEINPTSVHCNLDDIKKQINIDNQQEDDDILLTVPIYDKDTDDYIDTDFNLEKWDITKWIIGGANSRGSDRFPKLKLYKLIPNPGTIDNSFLLIVNPFLFKGLSKSEASVVRHGLVDTIFGDYPDLGEFYASNVSLGFYDIQLPYPIFAVYDNLIGIDNALLDTPMYFNTLNVNVPLTITIDELDKTYIITKKSATPNIYEIKDGDNNIIKTNIKDNDIVLLENKLNLLFGSLTVFAKINNPTNTGNINKYISKVIGDTTTNGIKLDILFKDKEYKNIKTLKIIRYNGICKVGTQIVKYSEINNKLLTFIDDTYNPNNKTIKYEIEITLKNGQVLKTNKLPVEL